MQKILFLFLALLLNVSLDQKTEAGLTMKISSPSFKDQAMIPRKFTCQGEDVNPALVVEGIPPAAGVIDLGPVDMAVADHAAGVIFDA